MKRYVIYTGLGALAAFAILMYLIATDPGDNLTVIQSFGRVEPSGENVVYATLRNNTSKTYALVEAEVQLLDLYGHVVGKARAQTTNLAAQNTWEFETRIPSDAAVRYRIKNLTCSPTLRSSDWQKKRACAFSQTGALRFPSHARHPSPTSMAYNVGRERPRP